MTVVVDGKRFAVHKYESEMEFEADLTSNSKSLLGAGSVYIDAKKKIESKSLGATVPDGFFFDFSDPTDPQFYIVEVELASHSFYSHIFPQITKFFAFFKNPKLQKSLVDKLFTIIDGDKDLRKDLRERLGHPEIYKFLTDVIELSQNILLVSNGPFAELPEIMDTYTDTWGRMVRFLEIRKYIDCSSGLSEQLNGQGYQEASASGDFSDARTM